jgi:micrococcal nuclease
MEAHRGRAKQSETRSQRLCPSPRHHDLVTVGGRGREQLGSGFTLPGGHLRLRQLGGITRSTGRGGSLCCATRDGDETNAEKKPVHTSPKIASFFGRATLQRGILVALQVSTPNNFSGVSQPSSGMAILEYRFAFVEPGTRFFWVLIAVLLGASVFFGLNAESRRRAVQTSETSLANGAIVSVVRIVDGDTLLVNDEARRPVVVRLLGIKALAVQPERDPASRFGRAAIDELGRLTENQPLRVLLHDSSKDRHGRTLAELFVGQEDLGLHLVKRGLALAYTVYPFPSLPLYTKEQEEARAERRGLWNDEHAARQADLMIAKWGREAQ